MSLDHGPAIEENGTFSVRIQLSVDDIRAYAYEDATLTLDDGSTETVSLQDGHFSTAPTTGFVSVDLGEEVGNRTINLAAERDGVQSIEETFDLTIDEENVVPERPGPDEYNEVTAVDEESGVVVESGGDGLSEADLSVTDHTPEQNQTDEMDYLAGPIVQIENQTEVDQAEITLPIDESVENLDNLSVFRWEPADSTGWVPVETTIDAQNRTAAAQTESFSNWAVFDESTWESAQKETISLEERHVVGNLNGKTDGSSWADGGDLETDWYRYDDSTWEIEEGTAGLVDTPGDSRSGVYRNDNIDLDVNDELHVSFEGYFDSAQMDEHELTQAVALLNSEEQEINPEQLILAAEVGSEQESASTTSKIRRGSLIRFGSQADTSTWMWGDVIDEHEIDSLEGHLPTNEWISVDLWYQPEEEECRLVAEWTDSAIEQTAEAEDCHEDLDGTTVESVAIGGVLTDDKNEIRLRNVAIETGGSTDQPTTPDDIELKDTNNDGIPDVVAEANPVLLPAQTLTAMGEEQDRINIDPVLEDTTGDGLSDSETIDVSYDISREDGEWMLETWVEEAIAHPGEYDTAGNGLSDYEEVQIGTNPWQADTSGDGLIDLVDPNPLEKSVPPEVTVDVREKFDGRIEVEVVVEPLGESDGVEEATLRVLDPGNSLPSWLGGGSEWVDTSVSDRDGDAKFSIINNRVPDEIEVSALDNKGHRTEIEYDVESESLTGTVGVSALGAATAFPSGAAKGGLAGSTTLNPSGVAGGIVAGGAAAATKVAILESQSEPAVHSGTPEYSVATSTPKLELSVPELTHPTIQLPSGASYNHEQLERDRKHGWEQITELPGINSIGAVEEVIRNPNAVREDGRFERVIGDNPGGNGLVDLRIIGGTIVAADLSRPVEHDSTESNCHAEDFEVETDNSRGEEGNPEHTLRDEKPVNDRNTLDDIIKNPDQILDFGDRRYLIKALDDGASVLRLNKNHKYDSVYELITQLTGENDGLFDSIDDAIDGVIDEDGHKPTKEIDC